MSDTKKTGPTPPRLGAFLLPILLGLSACNGETSAKLDQCQDSKDIKTVLASQIGGDVAAFQLLDEPRQLPPVTFNDKDGKQLSPSALKGKTVLVNLWATWCAPCRKEMPALDALQNQLGNDEFAVVPISVDLGDDTKPKAFFSEIGIKDLPFYHDGTMGIFNTLRKESLAFGLPLTMLLDKQGCVLGSLNGEAIWDGVDAKNLITQAINAQK